MSFNRNNFHKKTFCIFRSADVPTRLPDHTSKSGSQYWFVEDGVWRNSNHWGRAAKCRWRLAGATNSATRTKCGFASWSDFSEDIDTEKLYYIRIDDGIPDYFHKRHAEESEFLRTSGDTVKRIRQLRQFLKTADVEAKNHDEILSMLISSDLPMWKIRAATFGSSS